MDSGRYHLVTASLIISILISVFPLGASAELELSIHNIDTGEDFETIQQAINDPDTLVGHTILVDEGIYYENLVVNKSISLVGEDKFNTTVDGGGRGTVINVTASFVEIANLTIQHGGSRYGIYIHRPSERNTISYNIVKNNSIGIWLNASDNNILYGNDCDANDFDGIFLKGSNKNVLSENIARNNEFGIWIEASTDNSISFNNASDNRNSGFYMKISSDNQFTDNIALDGQFGFWIEKSTRNIFSNNVVSCGPESYGFTLIDSDNNTMSRNSASDNFLGVRLDESSSGNRIFHNNFFNNNLTLRGFLHNSLDNGIEGNYWSNYNGTDNDQDGIGDTPYVKNENNTDNSPLMGLFFDFKVGPEGKKSHVYAVSNCTVHGFQHNISSRAIRFKIDGTEGTQGFCRIMIPKLLISYEPYVLLVNDEEVDANLLSVSNVTHAFFYFTYNLSTIEVTILSKSYFELLVKHDSLLEDLDDLNEIYDVLLGNFTGLLESLNSLQKAYDDLSTLYNSLNSTYHNLKSQSTRELNNVRSVMYAFMFLAILGTLFFLPIGGKYYRISKKQSRIIQSYSPFEIANALFKTDVERRRLKIEKFEDKYDLKIRPRDTLEDVIKTYEEKKKVKR